VKDFQNLKVWEKSHRLVIAVYRATAAFPSEERFGLTSQMRRAAASIPSNIAEGCGRGGDAELARFLDVAAGSAAELQYQLLLAHELDFLNGGDFEPLTEHVIEVKRMLSALIQKLKAVG
jgi:four helix bundle protein